MAYVTQAALRSALKVPAGAEQDANLDAACAAATVVIDTFLGLDESYPDPVPPEVGIAALQIASRAYRAGDVVFGLLNSGDFGSAFTGRFVTPEIEMLLLGKRKKFGVA